MIGRLPNWPYPHGDDWKQHAIDTYSALIEDSTHRREDYEAITPWLDARIYDSLDAAVTSIGSTVTTLVVSAEMAVTDNTTVPTTMALRFERDGSLNIAAGKTATINGFLDAGLFQIFEGAGSVAFGAGAVKEVYPQWWGAAVDGSTNDSIAYQAAIDSLGSDGGTVLITTGTLSHASRIEYKDKIRIVGVGINASVTYYTGNDYAYLMGSGTSSSLYALRMADLKILGTSSAIGGVKMHGVARFDFNNVQINGFSQNMGSATGFDAGFGINFYDCVCIGSIRACWITENHIGIHAKYRTATVFNAVSIEGGTELKDNDYAIILGDPDDSGQTVACGIGSVISNSAIEGNEKGGIWNVHAYAFHVIANYFETNGGFSIRLGSTDGNTVPASLNRIFANYFSSTDNEISVDILRGRYNQLTGNYLASGTTAINLGSAAEYTKLKDNDITSSGYSNTILDSGVQTRRDEGSNALARVYRNAAQENIANTTATKVELNAEIIDTGDNFDSTTNHRYVAPIGGYYRVSGTILYTSVVTDKTYEARILRNGTLKASAANHSSSTDDISVNVSDLIYMSAGQYLELYSYHNAGVNTVDIVGSASSKTFMSVEFVAPE